MANTAVATLEAALRARKLDRTLTGALAPLGGGDPAAALPTGVTSLDAVLRGGLPRGQLSEIAGAPSSGRTTVLLQVIGAATRRGEVAALVDTSDRLDVASAAGAGVQLDRLLWVRGSAGGAAGRVALPLSIERGVTQALKAFTLVLQARGFGLVALDLADVPAAALRRLPFTTWLRVQRAVEGSDTACVLVVPEPLARSAGGVTLSLDGAVAWGGGREHRPYLQRLHVAARVVSPRRHAEGTVTVEALAV
jgi:hypothetical protein